DVHGSTVMGTTATGFTPPRSRIFRHPGLASIGLPSPWGKSRDRRRSNQSDSTALVAALELGRHPSGGHRLRRFGPYHRSRVAAARHRALHGAGGHPVRDGDPARVVGLLHRSHHPAGECGCVVPCAIGASSPSVSGAVLLVYSVSRFAVVRFNGATHQDGVFGSLFAAPIVPADRGPDALPLWHVPDLNDLLLHVFLLHEWNPDAWHRIDGSYWTLPVQVAA